jgi:hypothetical protein
MTVEWAQSILEHYELKLGHGVWVPTQSRPDQCCPLGLYVIDKDGYEGNYNDFIHKEWRESGGYWAGATSMTRRIADHVGLPFAYAIGLSNGFEGENGHYSCTKYTAKTEEERELYELGLADGKALIPLVK